MSQWYKGNPEKLLFYFFKMLFKGITPACSLYLNGNDHV